MMVPRVINEATLCCWNRILNGRETQTKHLQAQLYSNIFSLLNGGESTRVSRGSDSFSQPAITNSLS